MTEDQFAKIAAIVIDKLEGGYYHPKMMFANPSRFKGYERSGETMFGLDRHAGHGNYYSSPRKSSDVRTNLKYIESGVYQYKNEASKEFWKLIDRLDAKNKWSWNYKGGEHNKKLKILAGRVLYPQYLSLSERYLTPAAQKAVNADPRLVFHFSYAVWNGSGWFQRYAKQMNEAVASGVQDKDELVKLAVERRVNDGNWLVAQTGRKILAFINTTTFPTLEVKKKKTIAIIVASLTLVALFVAGGVLIKSMKND